MSPLAAMAVIATMFGRILVQLHRPESPEELLDDLGNSFWRMFRIVDNILIKIGLCFPSSSAAGSWCSDPTALFLAISRQACTICLHQAALFKAANSPRLDQESAESKLRCINSAQEILNTLMVIDDRVLLQVCL